MASAREAALLTLTAMDRQKAWSNGHLQKAIRDAGLDRRDAALATRLCFGVLQNRLLLDFYLQQCASMKLEKMESKVRNGLRIGLYQMLFLDKIPASAAVSEAVELTKKHCKNPRAAGLVNGILRALARRLNDLPALDRTDRTSYLSLLYSHPRWLVESFASRLPEDELEPLLQWDNGEPPVTVQVNTTRTTLEETTASLEAEGVAVQPHPWLPGCLILSATGDLAERTAYKEGLIYAQDPAARLAVLAMDPKPGDKVLDACAAPGGTGALRLAVGNYSSIGDTILTTDWHWGPYGKIAGEIGRSVETFRLFDNDRNFDVEEFRSHVNGLAEKQDTLLIILNSPGQNPTGYRLTDEEWKSVIAVLSALPSSKKIALVADTAYIDFAGDEDDVRTFLPLFDTLPDNVMALLAYSFSKTFTLYGMRCGALIGLAPDERTAEEFSRVTEYSGRASWSNCARAGQAIIEHIYEDPALLERVTAERTEIRNMLLARGAAFGEEASKCGLDMLPYNGGFFAVVPCENAKEVGLKLEKEAHAFTIPFGDGLRVSLAAMPMTQCRILPQKMKDVLSSME